MEGTIARGLEVTAYLLHTADHEGLVALMQKSLTGYQSRDSTIVRSFSDEAQDDRLLMIPPSDRNATGRAREAAALRRDPVHFEGDAVPPTGPPLAWVQFWHGKYSNAFGNYIAPSLVRCGAFMWDGARWEGMGGEKRVEEAWAEIPKMPDMIEADLGWHPFRAT